MPSSPPLTTGTVALAGELLDSVDVLATRLAAQIQHADRHYQQSQLLTGDQLLMVCRDNLTAILGYLAGRSPLRLQSAVAAGRLKAEQGLPLAAMLHAYRLGGRLIWAEIMAGADGIADRELLALPAELWRVVDLYSDAAAESYRETETLLAFADAESRSRLVRTLFDDHSENPARVLDALRALGLPETGNFLVVTAEIADTRTLRSGEAARALARHGIASVWDTHADAQVGLICGSAPADPDHAVDELARLFDGRIGVSRMFARPHGIAAALDEARLALKCAPPGTAALTRYDDAPLALVLVRLPEAAHSAAAQILGPLLDLPTVERDELLATMEAWFECGGSNAATAERLHYHRNTVLYRLHKIRDLTGRGCDDPAQAAELYIALRALRLCG